MILEVDPHSTSAPMTSSSDESESWHRNQAFIQFTISYRISKLNLKQFLNIEQKLGLFMHRILDSIDYTDIKHHSHCVFETQAPDKKISGYVTFAAYLTTTENTHRRWVHGPKTNIKSTFLSRAMVSSLCYIARNRGHPSQKLHIIQ